MAEQVPWRERSRLVRAARLLRTRRPVTFSEKVQYKMLRDHRNLLVTFADKAGVRDHVAAVVGDRYLSDCYGVVDRPEDLAALELPESWVLKPTHGSGAVLVVTPDAPAAAVLPDPDGPWLCTAVRPEGLDRRALHRLCAAWLDRVHGGGPNTEWAYGHVPPRLLVEEYLQVPDGAPGAVPDDHKLFVFHGRCRYVQVDTGRFGAHTQDFFLPASWERLPLSGGLPAADPVPARPARLAEMIAVAERLGRDTDFVRVDLYALGDRVVVGELTNYPAAGHPPFFPTRFDAEFGRHWTVPRRYRDVPARAGRSVRAARDGQLAPHDLAAAGGLGAPPFGHGGDDLQAAPVVVLDAGIDAGRDVG